MAFDYLGAPYGAALEQIGADLEAGTRRPKHYMCLNLGPKWHRWAIVLHLADRGWLAQGNVSFFGEHHGFGPPSPDPAKPLLNPGTMGQVAALPSGPRLMAHAEAVHARSPLTFLVASDAINAISRHRTWGKLEFLFPEGRRDGRPNPPTAYFEIVTESWVTDGGCTYFTEKTIRPLIGAKPFILVGCPGSLRHLRTLGFQTFAPHIDETYDDIDDPHERLEVIFREIDRLNAMSLADLHDMTRRLWPVLRHNAEYFRDALGRIFAEQWQSRIEDQLG
jgi:hypothetical protein